MSETKDEKNAAVKLDGLYAFKVGMSAVYNEAGERVPVTVLKYEPMVISQIKSVEKDGYAAVQVAIKPSRDSRTSAAMKKHLTPAGFTKGAQFIHEIRPKKLPEGVQVGQRIAIDSFKKGDILKVTGTSRGRGFSGAIRRWNFAGGPGSHGSGFHRQPGSVGNRTWPGRVIPGKRLPGQYGNETVTVRNVQLVDVIPEENVFLVKGQVPGSRNSLVRLMKV